MTSLPYWDTLRANLNLMPLRTVRLFLNSYSFMPRAVIVNLAGNIAVFIPLGLFLPCLWRRQRLFGRFLLTVTAAVAAIELLQLFTMMGSCDIDDLILNLAGASIGFAIFSLPPVKRGLGSAGFIR
jgi:glycopeptide antibiotics resistance protein